MHATTSTRKAQLENQEPEGVRRVVVVVGCAAARDREVYMEASSAAPESGSEAPAAPPAAAAADEELARECAREAGFDLTDELRLCSPLPVAAAAVDLLSSTPGAKLTDAEAPAVAEEAAAVPPAAAIFAASELEW